MLRFILALKNSVDGLRHLLQHETAFKQECVVLIAAIPVGYIISSSLVQFCLLLLMLLLVIIVEILNSAIEAVCDALSVEFDANIKIAKDCGSLAVLISILIAAAIWGFSFVQWMLRFG